MPAQASASQPPAADTEPVTTVTTYAVQEYHPYDQQWVIAWGDIDTADEAIAKRNALAAKCAEAGDAESQFRVTEVISVTTTRVVD